MGNDSRRPLASRDTQWARWLAKTLAERGVMPNQVSLASTVFAGVGGIALAERAAMSGSWLDDALLVVGVVGIQGRLLCNLIDGMIAVEGRRSSPVGDLYNDIPDRISDVVLLVGAGIGVQPVFLGALWFGWLAAAGAMMTAYIRALGAACGTPHYFAGPMAKPHRMACLTAGCVLEILLHAAGVSWCAVGWSLVIIAAGSAYTCIRRTKMISAMLWAKAGAQQGARV